MNENIYDINYRRLITWLLPTALRKPMMLSWLITLISPIIKLYTTFLLFRRSVLYRLQITPQVCYLEKLLNDRYDFNGRGIRIADATTYEALYIFKKTEEKPLWLYTQGENKSICLRSKKDSGVEKIDFYVLIPKQLNYEENELRALLNSYKLPVKAFAIQKI